MAGFIIVTPFFKKPNEYIYAGYIDKSRIFNKDENQLLRSLSYNCDVCNKETVFDIYEGSNTWSLFFIPLGNGDYHYHVVCKECGTMQFQFKPRDYTYLKNEYILIEKDERFEIGQAGNHKQYTPKH